MANLSSGGMRPSAPQYKKATPTSAPKTRMSPLQSTLSQQEKRMVMAQNVLEAERKVYSKKYGQWPSDSELAKFRLNG